MRAALRCPLSSTARKGWTVDLSWGRIDSRLMHYPKPLFVLPVTRPNQNTDAPAPILAAGDASALKDCMHVQDPSG
jgi:hypothetical protein